MMPELFSDTEKAELTVLYNSSVDSYSWDSCTVEVKDRATGKPKFILDNVSGFAKAGKCCCALCHGSATYQPSSR
jgi:hypothetical protein